MLWIVNGEILTTLSLKIDATNIFVFGSIERNPKAVGSVVTIFSAV
jgi:predicted nucleotidyltransferase